MKLSRRELFPAPHTGELCLRSTVYWNERMSTDRGPARIARVGFYFSTCDRISADDYGSMSYGDGRDGLMATCYVDPNRGPHVGGDGTVYGLSVGYQERFFVERRDAEIMAHVLAHVERKLAKTAETTGQRPATFGAYVIQVAQALGVPRILTQYAPETAERTGMRWRWEPATDAGAYAVNGYIGELLRAERQRTGLDAERPAAD